MCRLAWNILLACVVQLHNQEQASTHASNMQDSLESLVKTLFVLELQVGAMYRVNLETSVFSMLAHPATLPSANMFDVLECNASCLGLVNRMRCNLLDGSLKELGLRSLNVEMSRLGKCGR